MGGKSNNNEVIVPIMMAVVMFLMLFAWNIPEIAKKAVGESEEMKFFENQKELIMKITEKEKEDDNYFVYTRSKEKVYKVEVDKKYYYKKIVGESMYATMELDGERIMVSTEEDMEEYKYEEIELEEQNT